MRMLLSVSLLLCLAATTNCQQSGLQQPQFSTPQNPFSNFNQRNIPNSTGSNQFQRGVNPIPTRIGQNGLPSDPRIVTDLLTPPLFQNLSPSVHSITSFLSLDPNRINPSAFNPVQVPNFNNVQGLRMPGFTNRNISPGLGQRTDSFNNGLFNLNPSGFNTFNQDQTFPQTSFFGSNSFTPTGRRDFGINRQPFGLLRPSIQDVRLNDRLV